MILGKSNHPVEIKKVSVRIWSLRSEIELHLKEISQIENEEEKQAKLEELKTYFKLIERTGKDAEVIDGGFSGSMDDDEFAKMAESIEAEGGSEEGEPTEATDEDTEAADVEAAGDDEVDTGMGDYADMAEEDNVVSLYPENLKLIERCAPESSGVGFSFLSDLNMHDGLLFSSEAFTIGQTVVIEFLVPKKFYISANITYCRNLAINSKIISNTKPKYRICFETVLSYPGERTHLRDFLKSVEPEIPVEPVRAAAPSNDEDDDLDDLDELADFGF